MVVVVAVAVVVGGCRTRDPSRGRLDTVVASELLPGGVSSSSSTTDADTGDKETNRYSTRYESE